MNRALGKAGLVVAGFLVAALLTEVGLRLVGIGSPVSGVDVFQSWEPTSPYLSLEVDPYLVLRPNYQGVLTYRSRVDDSLVYSVNLRTSSVGLRGAEPDPAHARTRVLGVGDSVTFGQGVAEEDTFLEVFERTAPIPLEVLNAGVPTWDLHAEVAWLESFGWELKPDAVLIATYVNDVMRSPRLPPEGGGHRGLHLAPSWAVGERGLRQWSNLANLLARLRDRERLLRQLAVAEPSRRSPNISYVEELRSEMDPAALRQEYDRLRRSCVAHGVPCAVAILPLVIPCDPRIGTEILNTIDRVATDSGLPVIRLDDTIAEVPAFDRFVLPADQHPSATAHSAIGRALSARWSLPSELGPAGPASGGPD